MLKIFLDRVKRVGITKTILISINRIAFALMRINKIAVRKCQCCSKVTVFAQLGRTNDAIRCIRCGANRRYELLAQALISTSTIYSPNAFVVEMDPGSPLSPLLERSGCHYLRTFYSESVKKGVVVDGAQMEDICGMTFADNTVDILITSDVLEHVPDLHLSIREAYRVLKPSGRYYFTVPVLAMVTEPRALIQNGEIVCLKPPIYHLDPLNPEGCLVFWDFGDDLVGIFEQHGFRLEVVNKDDIFGYKVWLATKIIPLSENTDA